MLTNLHQHTFSSASAVIVSQGPRMHCVVSPIPDSPTVSTKSSFPASEALERCSKRRRKSDELLPCSAFVLDDVFRDIAECQDEPAFPKISWSFDDEPNKTPESTAMPTTTTVDKLHVTTSWPLLRDFPTPDQSPSTSSRMIRSKSFKHGLAQLSSVLQASKNDLRSAGSCHSFVDSKNNMRSSKRKLQG